MAGLEQALQLTDPKANRTTVIAILKPDQRIIPVVFQTVEDIFFSSPFHKEHHMKFSEAHSALGQVLLCPYCGFDYVHPISVEVLPVNGTTSCCIDADGISLTPSNAAQFQRGIKIVLRFYCEQGHLWDSVLSFRKGSVYLENHLRKTLRPNSAPPKTLWRD